MTFLPAARAVAGQEALAHHTVSTRNGEAQRAFDRGLGFVYAFNPEEAIYEFQKAAAADPQLAMAYWGIALALGPNVNTPYDFERARVAREAIDQARRLDGHAPDAERRYVEALAKRYGAANPSQVDSSQRSYANAMSQVARRAPSDLDAQTLYAESLMDLTPLQMWTNGRPNQYTEITISALKGVLKRDKDHVGANHLLLHAVEDGPHPEQGLQSARRLSVRSLPPAAEHLAHMPDHIFLRTGSYGEAARSGERAVSLFRSYLREEHGDGHNGYFHHDLQVLDYAYMMTGHWSQARAAADEIARQVDDNGAAAETYLRFGRYRELLSLAPPKRPGIRWQFARALASARIGDVRVARDELHSLAPRPSEDPRTAISRNLLEAAIAEREHRDTAAIYALEHAVKSQDQLRLVEPPGWYYPIRESLGARLALSRRDADAARVFRADLNRNPGNPRSLYGLSRAIANSDPTGSRKAASDFARAWRGADVPLTLQSL